MKSSIIQTVDKISGKTGKVSAIIYEEKPVKSVIMVYPYAVACLKSSGVKVSKDLLKGIWDLIPTELQENKIVVVVEDTEGIGTDRRFAVWFKDSWAMIGKVTDIQFI